MVIGDNGSLTIDTANDSDAGFGRIGDYECLVTNGGYSQGTIIYTITEPIEGSSKAALNSTSIVHRALNRQGVLASK